MALTITDWIIIATYFVISLAIGLYFRKSASNNLSDFFLGGRNIPWLVAGLSMVATTFAADTPLAITELVNTKGISGNWLWWNMLMGGMLTTFFFARLWRRANIMTEVEFLELRYGGRWASYFRGFKAVYLGLFMNVLVIAWVNLAMVSILQVFFGLSPATALWYVAGIMVIATLYSSLSGLIGVAVTDAFQFFIAIGGAVLLAVYVIGSKEIGGIEGLKTQLPLGALDFFPHFSDNGITNSAGVFTITIGSFLAYLGMQWWASWYPGAEPGGGGYIAQRMMSTRSEKDSLKATLFFQITHYVVRPWPWILVALSTMVLYPHLPADEIRNGYVMAIKDYLPAGVRGLMLVAMVAAYMSTISTQLNWGSSYIVNDLYQRFWGHRKTAKQMVAVGRFTTVILMALGLYVTTLVGSISGVWSFLLECGAGLGLVLILRWYWWRINLWSEVSATLSPFVYYFIAKYFLLWVFPQSFFFTVGLTTITWLVVTFATKPESVETLHRFVSRVRPEGMWTPVYQNSSISEPSNAILRMTFISWLSAVVLAYSLLFSIGKFLFHDYAEGFYWLGIASVGLIVLVFSMRKM
jgi:Na+/proline symporter